MGAKTALKPKAHKVRVTDQVWVLRPQPMGTYRSKTWPTRGDVVCRIGDDTYRIKVSRGQFRKRHEGPLRACEHNICGKHVSLDYTAHDADSQDNYAEHDNYTVENTLAQRPNAPGPGGVEFKVRWRGYGLSHDTTRNLSLLLCRGSTPPSWSMSPGTRLSSGSGLSKLLPGRLKPWATDPRPELSLFNEQTFAQVCQVVNTSLACFLSSNSGAMLFRWSG